MQFTEYDMGQLERDQAVEVTLSGSAANVRLMDSSNLSAYKSGRQHRYYGGLMKSSPARIGVPHSGHWYVPVDMQGLRGSTRSSVRVLPSPLPTFREAPLASMPSLVNDAPRDAAAEQAKPYDVFVSHASEDKDTIGQGASGMRAGSMVRRIRAAHRFQPS